MTGDAAVAALAAAGFRKPLLQIDAITVTG
jgi:hypothetical protein